MKCADAFGRDDRGMDDGICFYEIEVASQL